MNPQRVIARLGDLIQPAAVERAGETAYPVLSMTMRDGLVDQADKFKKRIASADTSAYKVVRRHQLVVGFPIDEGVLAFQELYNAAIVSPAYAIWDLKKSVAIDRTYLQMFLRSEGALKFYRSRLRNTTARRRSLPDDIFLALEVPVPPLAEQERIVKLLDEADALRKLRTQADQRTATLIPALFHEMFGDATTNSKRWLLKSFADVGRLDRGRSKHRPRDDASLYGGKHPFIQTGDVANANGRITSYSQTYSEKGLAQSRLWPADTLVITIAANIGKTAILTFPACFPDSLVGFIPGPEVDVEYVRHWLVTIEGHLDKVAPQMAQKNINLKILNDLHLPLPPLSLQKTFAARVVEIRELEARQAASRQRLDALFQSMLHRAFNGEL